MEWVEITARTVQEATETALDNLGVDEVDAEIEVLEEPQPGLFGRTRGKARVRVRVVPRQQPPKQEGRDRRRSRNGKAKAEPAAASTPQDEPRDSEPPARSQPRKRSSRSSAAVKQGDSMEATMTLAEQTAVVEEFMSGLATAFGTTPTVEVVEVDEETREVRVDGDDLGLLIGPRGLTLQAVGELARTVVFRAAPGGQEGRVRVDVSGYREKRREALVRFATKVAADVVTSGESKALEPMNPPDRKVVHDTINDIDGVRTTSEGQEPRRRVVVLPE